MASGWRLFFKHFHPQVILTFHETIFPIAMVQTTLFQKETTNNWLNDEWLICLIIKIILGAMLTVGHLMIIEHIKKHSGRTKVMPVESWYCKPFPPRILLSTWFWSISSREKLFSSLNLKNGWTLTVLHLPHKIYMINRSGTDQVMTQTFSKRKLSPCRI